MQFCKACVVFILATAFFNKMYAQDTLSKFSSKVITDINEKIISVDYKLSQASKKSLKRILREEHKIKLRIHKIDSVASNQLFRNLNDIYSQFASGLDQNPVIPRNRVGEYIPLLDSIKTSLKFMNENYEQLNLIQSSRSEIAQALSAINGLEKKMLSIQLFQNFISERKNMLKNVLSRNGILKSLKKFDKEVFYFSQKTKELKSVLNNPSKIKIEAFRALNKIPMFHDFFEKNSFVGSLFGSTNYSSLGDQHSDIPGLQLKTQVDKLLTEDIMNVSGSNMNPVEMLKEKLSSAKKELDQLKSKNSSWADNTNIPDFKPNEMKTKSFFKRMELGTNLQLTKPNTSLPAIADIAGQVSYKFHQNGDIGLGASYKIGYGSLRRVSISHQGVGLRSFFNYKLKGKVYLNGGMEYNYITSFQNIDELRQYKNWQRSALLGINKKYNISQKLKGSIIVLYDFLYNSHKPISQPFLFRIGYNF